MDAMGRTPLLWAAGRGGHRAVQILLDHNANPNIADMYLAPAISYAADRGHTSCVKLLLETDATVEPVLPPGIKIGSPLNCAARNAENPTLLKHLLTYGAHVDGTGVDGNTALHHASRKDNIRFAVLLLDSNADFNATNINQQTPLTSAVMYNSHRGPRASPAPLGRGQPMPAHPMSTLARDRGAVRRRRRRSSSLVETDLSKLNIRRGSPVAWKKSRSVV